MVNELISIIIPVFNRFEYADRAILSVLHQTYTNWELFVVDDCSDQQYELPKACESIQQKIQLHRNEKNSGPGLSRQQGLDLSTGTFVCFLDSDDYYSEEFLDRMLKKLEENSDCSGAYCTSFDIFENKVRKSSNNSFDKIMPTLFDEYRPWSTCSWLWRRECLPKWTNERTNEDSLFEINVAMNNNKIVHVNEVLCYIDKGTGSNTVDLLGSTKNELDRNNVVRFCIQNLSKFKSDKREIGEGCLRRVLYVSARLLKLGELGIVGENLKLLQKYEIGGKQYKSYWFLKIGVCLSHFSRSLGFKFVEWSMVNSNMRFT